MTADLRPIIADIASRADDFLAGSSHRAQARAGIEEVVTMDYPTLNPDDRKVVVGGVMNVLARIIHEKASRISLLSGNQIGVKQTTKLRDEENPR